MIEVLTFVHGARVRRVDVPEPDLVALTLAIGRDRTSTLILSASEQAPGIGLVDERPRGAPAGSLAQLLRKHLVGAAIVAATSPGQDHVIFGFARGAERASLHVSVRRRAGAVVLLDVDGRALGGLPRGPASISEPARAPADADAWPRDLDELTVAGQALIARRRGEGERDHHAELRRGLVKARARVARRLLAIQGDLAGTSIAPKLRADASLVLQSLGSIAAHRASVTLVDPETDAAREIALDPKLSATENAERWFVRARKLDRGAKIATQRLEEARAQLARFDDALAALAANDTHGAEALLKTPARREVAPVEPKRAPYRTFSLEDGSIVLVGRGARDNDALTFRHAAPDDLFFHARGNSGAHVVLRSVPGRSPTPSALDAAARLAAHFSASRADTAVDVSCAVRRELRRGKAPGAVVMRTSTTTRVRMDDAVLAALLAREIR